MYNHFIDAEGWKNTDRNDGTADYWKPKYYPYGMNVRVENQGIAHQNN
jgi:hypothetical protein